MKRLLKHILLTFLCGCIACGFSGCVDDLIDGSLWDDIPEGETVVGATVNFRPFSEGLSDTRSSGSAIKDVENLCVLVYRADTHDFVRSFYITRTGKEHDAVFTDAVDRTEEFPGAAEKKTGSVSFSMPLPYGRYQILAVANMGDITKNYSESVYKSIDNVRNIRLEWNNAAGKVGENNQMYGFFTNAEYTNYEPVGTELQEGGVTPNIVTVAKPGVSLQAWIKRAASKVTVAYDGSQLADNVRVYIQSVQIRDIPKYCLLGAPNTVAAKNGEALSALYEDRLYADGEKYVYTAADGGFTPGNITAETGGGMLNYGLYVSNGPSNSHRGSDHSEDDPHSLYFFENNQGTGEPKWQDKNATPGDPNSSQNAQVSYPGSLNENHEYFKDKKRGGTFIEVKGFYLSDNEGRPGSGYITYRFMLGQDTDRDYRALRNCHYKLTLMFKGYGNDIDWHIEFVEPDPSMTVRSPQYVSYLYNREMHFNVKIAGAIPAGNKIKAIITENHWYPSNADNSVYYVDAKNFSQSAPLAGATRGDENGFLSLYKPATAVIGAGQGYNSSYNYDYYFKGSNPLGTPIYKREYETNLKTGADKKHYFNGNANDWHEVTEVYDADGGRSLVFKIPLYTRARSLSESRGHTGNNIFGAHERQAFVNLELDMGGGVILQKTVDVRQVERIENPKAIWRSEECDDPFDILLKHPSTENGTTYVDVKSDGPWRAEKVTDNGIDASWYTITPLGESETGPDGTVTGRDKTKIHLQFKPNGKNTTGSPKCGVIRIYYNNYTCVHLIFVRQGYQPLALREGDVKWHTSNVVSINSSGSGNTLTFDYREGSDPRDEGSMFRWCSSYGITSEFTRTTGTVGVAPSSFETTRGTVSSWDGLKGVTRTTWPDQKDSDGKIRLATHEDFMRLYSDQDQNFNTDIEYGYGVLYGDGAKKTADNLEGAVAYDGTTGRGMRGCIVYNHQNGRQIFFPIGATGYGRRKDQRLDKDGNVSPTSGEKIGTGVLRYANRYEEYVSPTSDPNQLKYRPLFRDLYLQKGAVYWVRNMKIDPAPGFTIPSYGDRGENQSAWDINYQTLNFKYFSSNAYTGSAATSDACFIRLVTDSK